MKKYDLELKVSTFVINNSEFREIFKTKFNWKGEYYFDMFVGASRFKTDSFLL